MSWWVFCAVVSVIAICQILQRTLQHTPSRPEVELLERQRARFTDSEGLNNRGFLAAVRQSRQPSPPQPTPSQPTPPRPTHGRRIELDDR